MDRLRLEILTKILKIIFNQHLFSVISVISVRHYSAPFTYLNTTNSIQGNIIIHLTANFIQKPAIYRSLLDHFSLVPRSSLVVLSFVIR